MFQLFKRTASRPKQAEPAAVRREPFLRTVPAGLEVTEGSDESDWALWEDSVESANTRLRHSDDAYARVGRRDR